MCTLATVKNEKYREICQSHVNECFNSIKYIYTVNLDIVLQNTFSSLQLDAPQLALSAIIRSKNVT